MEQAIKVIVGCVTAGIIAAYMLSALFAPFGIVYLVFFN